jgi:hypothetical protein
MAFKSAAENLFEDDQQLWPSNLLLQTFEVMNSYGLQICYCCYCCSAAAALSRN